MYVTDEKEEILLGHKHIDHFEALNNSMAYIFKGLFPKQLPPNHTKPCLHCMVSKHQEVWYSSKNGHKKKHKQDWKVFQLYAAGKTIIKL